MNRRNIFFLITSFFLLITTAACGLLTNEQEEKNIDTHRSDFVDEKNVPDETTVGEEDIANTEESYNSELVSPVTLYYVDNDLMNLYRVEFDKELPKNEQGVKAALELWINEPVIDGLHRNVPENVTVQSVKDVSGTAYISFSKNLLDANLGSSGERFLVDQIAMTVEQFGFNETMILIEGEEKETLLGHIDLSEPIIAKTPAEYKYYKQK